MSAPNGNAMLTMIRRDTQKGQIVTGKTAKKRGEVNAPPRIKRLTTAQRREQEQS